MSVTSSPSMTTRPSSGRSSPAMSFSSVDFPEPEGPSTAVSELSGISTLTSSTTALSPYRFVRWLSEIDMQFPLTRTKGRENYKSHDGDGGEHEGAREGTDGVKVLVPGVKDVDRQGLSLAGDVARDDQHGAELSERTRDGERHTVEHAPTDGRQRHLPEGATGTGAERARGVFLLLADLDEHRQD